MTRQPVMVAVAGPPMSGKTTMICTMAAALSQQGTTVTIVNTEDDPPRLRALLDSDAANVENVWFATEIPTHPITDVTFVENITKKQPRDVVAEASK